MPPQVWPVSYTHLDVYKRQALLRGHRHKVYMEMGRGLGHVQHHIEHPQMGIALLEGLRKLFESGCRPFPSGGCLLYTSRCV